MHWLLRSGKVRSNLLPVDDLPECSDVFGTAVLILEIVGMLPDVQPEQRCLADRYRTVLVRRRNDFQALFADDQPCPTTAESRSGCRVESFLKLLQRAEGFGERLRQFTS